MINKKPVRIVVFLLALSLSAPISVWAGYYGHHGYGHRGYYGHHGYGHRGYYAQHAYYGHPGYGHHYYPRFYGYSGHPQGGVASVHLGALDLNVKPKNTQVYLNGKYIGVTDNFDGVPRALWLKEGTYEIIFYLDGYATVVREFTIHPGVIIDVKQRLSPGASVPPGELTSTASPISGSEPRRESGE